MQTVLPDTGNFTGKHVWKLSLYLLKFLNWTENYLNYIEIWIMWGKKINYSAEMHRKSDFGLFYSNILARVFGLPYFTLKENLKISFLIKTWSFRDKL